MCKKEKDLQPEKPTVENRIEGQGVFEGMDSPVLSVRDGNTVVIPMAFLTEQQTVEVSLR